MAEQPAIRVEGLSKAYRIGFDRSKLRKRQLSDAFVDILARPLRQLRQGEALGRTEEFWALRDVNFQVQRGEVVGIIGRNGAGKSTLLKILSRVTYPTEGRVTLRGRTGSLLEVGTGFHPELTGRENVFLNGAILGMGRQEIKQKFDEIAAFSGVEKFLDTPVKRYSSGMRVRLAFAVAAHLDPKILMIDEVLAVGDVEFQKRCLGKMQEVAGEGRTVLFVSHNMAAIQNLCSRVLVLRGGQLVRDATADVGIREYLGELRTSAKDAFTDNPERSGSGEIQVTGIRILSETDETTTHLVAGEPATFQFTYQNPQEIDKAAFFFTIYNHLGIAVAHFNTTIVECAMTQWSREGRFTCRLPSLPLPIGQYRVGVSIRRVGGQPTDVIPSAHVFDVDSSVFYETGRMPPIQYSSCLMAYQWQHEAHNSAVTQEVGGSP